MILIIEDKQQRHGEDETGEDEHQGRVRPYVPHVERFDPAVGKVIGHRRKNAAVGDL